MNFRLPTRTIYRDYSLDTYFDGKCRSCGSARVITRSSYVREVPDIGSTVEKVIVRLKVCLVLCQDCGAQFTPEHPLFPPKLEYSLAVVEYALTRYHYHNASGNAIARDLSILHQVSVPEDTVYSWLKEHSPSFLKARIDAHPQDLSRIKTVTVDGSYVHVGTAAIGKKKRAESYSATKLADGRYLLMWWE